MLFAMAVASVVAGAEAGANVIIYSTTVLVMSNQRFLKIVCFRFPINVPKKIEYIRF